MDSQRAHSDNFSERALRIYFWYAERPSDMEEPTLPNETDSGTMKKLLSRLACCLRHRWEPLFQKVETVALPNGGSGICIFQYYSCHKCDLVRIKCFKAPRTPGEAIDFQLALNRFATMKAESFGDGSENSPGDM